MKDDNSYMRLAMEEANLAYAKDEVPIGAIIVDRANGSIVAKAHNLTRQTNDPSAHAECLAIREACQKQESQRIPNHDLFVTVEPCPMCASLISFARIQRVVFGACDPKSGGVLADPKLYEKSQLHHKPEIVSGVLEKECSELISGFFKEKRKSQRP